MTNGSSATQDSSGELRMPAEWAAHRRTWMCWPCRTEAWGSPDGLARAKKAAGRVARAISGFEPVVMAVRPEDAAERGKRRRRIGGIVRDAARRLLGTGHGTDISCRGGARRDFMAVQCLGTKIPSV